MGMVGVEHIYGSPTQSGGHLLPPADNTYDLGSVAFSWRNLYVDNLIYVTSTVMQGDMLPSVDGTYDLGSTTYEWQDLWIDGIAYIDALTMHGNITMPDAGAINTGIVDDDYFTIGAVDNDTQVITELMRFVGNANPYILVAQDIQMGDAKAIRTGVADDDNFKFEAWDKDGGAYVTMLTVYGGINTPYVNISRYDNGGLSIVDSIITITDIGTIRTTTGENDYFTFGAMDTGNTQLEVARVAGAADPYFSMGGNQEFKFYNSGYADIGGGLRIGETEIRLDHAIGTDQNYSGITCTGVLGETVIKGEVVYLEDSDNEWHKAQANGAATGTMMLGICLIGGIDSGATLILLQGFYRDDTAFEFGTGGQPLYLCDVTAGDIRATAPDTAGDIVRVVGYAHDDADTIYFNPDGAWVEIAA